MGKLGFDSHPLAAGATLASYKDATGTSSSPEESSLGSPLRYLGSEQTLPLVYQEKSRHGTLFKPWNVVRLFCWSCGVGVILLFALMSLGSSGRMATFGHATHDQEAYQIVKGGCLPDHPAPVMVTDRRGRSKWTVFIPPDLDFPLRPTQYADICAESGKMAQQVQETKSHMPGMSSHAGHYGYYYKDPHFMDVVEAESHGLLPTVQSDEEDNGAMDRDGKAGKLRACERSLTYVLESSNAGLGRMLMGLWMSYGLAKKEGRAFFIDDTNWAYGKYETYFAPPPPPGCQAPPRNQILPCPHQANHLLVSAATTTWTFGHEFNEEYEDPRAMEVMRQKVIFSLARAGYSDLFRLKDDDEAYVAQRKAEIEAQLRSEGTTKAMVGIHVRHGDRHPWEFKYHKSYIPLEQYISTAESMTTTITTTTDNNSSSFFLLATDDPTVYTSPILPPSTIHAQTRSPLPPATIFPHGFTNPAFHALLENTTTTTTTTTTINNMPSLIARTYLLDLKTLGESCPAIVCTVSSVTCRLLALMLGWPQAIEEGLWRNVDGGGEGWGWTGVEW